MSTTANILRRDDGATAAEFAMVLPLLILFLFGIIDVGRYMWTLNQVEKATQMGARMAVVTNMVPGGLASQNYGAILGQGAAIPTSQFGAAACSAPAGTLTCTCVTSPCPTLTPVDNTAFTAITTRMNQIAESVSPQDVTIRYDNSGLGYAGDPTGPDVAPHRDRQCGRRGIPVPHPAVLRHQFAAPDGECIADAGRRAGKLFELRCAGERDQP